MGYVCLCKDYLGVSSNQHSKNLQRHPYNPVLIAISPWGPSGHVLLNDGRGPRGPREMGIEEALWVPVV